MVIKLTVGSLADGELIPSTNNKTVLVGLLELFEVTTKETSLRQLQPVKPHTPPSSTCWKAIRYLSGDLPARKLITLGFDLTASMAMLFAWQLKEVDIKKINISVFFIMQFPLINKAEVKVIFQVCADN